ncbi:MAG: hypothetical protein NTZ87_00485 [Candidatus Nomurabacteria bacterium]|nr:hypothetical protein [Candidatus Nomurabacteria bacterium]
MKKQKRGGKNPLTITSQADAIMAFAHGDKLTKAERRSVIARYFPGQAKITLNGACKIAVEYSFDLVHEYGEDLARLTLAWLRLGEKVWSKIVTMVSNIVPVKEMTQFLERFYAMLQGVLSRRKPSWAW